MIQERFSTYGYIEVIVPTPAFEDAITPKLLQPRVNLHATALGALHADLRTIQSGTPVVVHLAFSALFPLLGSRGVLSPLSIKDHYDIACRKILWRSQNSSRKIFVTQFCFHQEPLESYSIIVPIIKRKTIVLQNLKTTMSSTL